MPHRDLYEVLGVPRAARKAEIERAGRKLERLHHPSLNVGDPETVARFEEIHLAFGVLRDPVRRKQYDRTGHVSGADPAPPAVQAAVPAPVPPADVYVTLRLSFQESAAGCQRSVSYAAQHACPRCGGGGCGSCGRTGRVQADGTAEVAVPAGVDSGSTLRLPRPDGYPGQLVVVTSVGDHPFYRRIGNNVSCELPVSVPEAALGARVEIPTLTGAASVRIPPGTQSGQKLRLRERGMPSLVGPARGDLYVEVRVVTPEARDVRVRSLLRELAKALAASGDAPRAGLPKALP